MEKHLDERKRQILLLQSNLSSIRKIAGWTTEQMGEKIGVTKQTISNLENGKTPMNFTQYIAIRSVLDCEIEENKENEVLGQVIEILLDRGAELDDESYEKVKGGIDTVAASAAGGLVGVALTGVYAGIVGPILVALGPIGGAVVGAVGAITGSKWLKKLSKKK